MIEEVNGIIIGQVETRDYYRFYSRKDNHLIWDAGHFENDKEAIKAFETWKDKENKITY